MSGKGHGGRAEGLGWARGWPKGQNGPLRVTGRRTGQMCSTVLGDGQEDGQTCRSGQETWSIRKGVCHLKIRLQLGERCRTGVRWLDSRTEVGQVLWLARGQVPWLGSVAGSRSGSMAGLRAGSLAGSGADSIAGSGAGSLTGSGRCLAAGGKACSSTGDRSSAGGGPERTTGTSRCSFRSRK